MRIGHIGARFRSGKAEAVSGRSFREWTKKPQNRINYVRSRSEQIALAAKAMYL